MAFIAALAAITNGVAPPHVQIITTIAAIILTTANPVVAYHFFLILFLACHTTLRDIDIRELALNTPNCLTIAGYKHRDKEPREQSNNIIDIRNYGNFNTKIIFETPDYKINPDIKYYKFENGILILRYELEKEKNNEIILKADEEI